MRAYVGATGTIFLLLAGAHLARVLAEGTGPLREPVFVVTTVGSILMMLWAVIVWKRCRS